MLKGIANDIALSVQARNGLSPAVIAWTAVIAFAALVAVGFLCVAGYAWLLLHVDSITAALIMAGIFAAIAVTAALVAALIRRQVRQRAILARAARARSPSWLLDPKILGVAVEAGRSIGWERILPVAVLGFVVAQWARDSRAQEKRPH